MNLKKMIFKIRLFFSIKLLKKENKKELKKIIMLDLERPVENEIVLHEKGNIEIITSTIVFKEKLDEI